MPVAAIIGAGPGLGLSMARRFGREGHEIALVSRNSERHRGYLAELSAAGVDAASFPADVGDREALDRALDQVVERFGAIDVVYYGPAPHVGMDGQPPVQSIAGADAAAAMSAVYPAVDVVAKVLPAMLERKAGTLLFTSAISALLPVPELGAMTLPAAAARSYALALNAALAPRGVFAGVLVIGGLIAGSDIHRAMAGPADFLLDPDRIADSAWDLVRRRRSAELIITPGRTGLGITALLISRVLRARRDGARAVRTRRRTS
jgi:NAD(P)-dependent dehydrogenase (short-subunit alcohol dehydrogenase family)